MGTENAPVNDSPPVERYYTYKEAAEILRIGYDTLRGYMARDQWPRYRLSNNRQRLIPESVVSDMLRSKLLKCQTRKSRECAQQ